MGTGLQWSIIGLALIAGAALHLEPASSRTAPGKMAFKSLPVRAFPQLPAPVADHLRRRGCVIPQSPVVEGPHNVIKGAFFGPRRADWAVTCSHNGTSAILVFRQGEARPGAELSKFDERQLGPANAEGVVEYPYKISAVGRREILYYQQAFGGPLPKRIDHQGIDDYYDGKASVIHYFDNGRWLELTGMD
jgi:hypothetical protein